MKILDRMQTINMSLVMMLQLQAIPLHKKRGVSLYAGAFVLFLCNMSKVYMVIQFDIV